MSDGHIYLIRFGGQPHTLPHSSLFPSCILFPLFDTFRLHFTGNIAQMNLPVGMRAVIFAGCYGLRGTAELEDE